jgi:thermitase
MLNTILYLSAFISLGLFAIGKEKADQRRFWGNFFLLSLGAYLLHALFVVANPFKTGVEVIGLVSGGLLINTFSGAPALAMLFLVGFSGGIFYLKRTPSTVTKSIQSPELDDTAELLVELKNGQTIQILAPLLEKYGLKAQPAFSVANGEITDLDDIYTLDIPADKLQLFPELVDALKNNPNVDMVESNELILLSPMETQKQTNSGGAVSDNPFGLNDAQIGEQWALEALGLQTYYPIFKTAGIQPAKKARLAILDTGVDGEHEDLKGNFRSTRSEYNQDGHGHGTHCAGIAAAVSNNGKGIASTAWGAEWVEVTSIQVFDARGRTTQARIIAGMIEAADKQADVLSMSLGGMSTDESQRAYTQAVKYANQKGAIVVVAAGNEDVDARLRTPASVDGVICVSAIDRNLQKAGFSNTVEHLKMGIAAPGVDILATLPNNQYGLMSGTSMATPYVAGLVAMMKAIRPTLNTQEAYNILKSTGKATQSPAQTGALIQPAKALQSLR